METWNQITGFLNNCLYCWAKRYAEKLATMGVESYKTHGFKPDFVEKRLKQRLTKRRLIFVSDIGDRWKEGFRKEGLR
jgi:protein gp37